MHMTQSCFVFAWNDAWPFLLNLFFASASGMERRLSRNSSTWSLSVEIALCAVLCQLPLAAAAPPRPGRWLFSRFLVVALFHIPDRARHGLLLHGRLRPPGYETTVASRHPRFAARATTVLA